MVVDLFATAWRKLRSVNKTKVTADSGFAFRDSDGDPNQIRANVQTFLDYEIAPDNFNIDLFRVEGPSGLVGVEYCDRALGWRYLVGNQLTIHWISGTHTNCMQPPHVTCLADQLNRILDSSTD